MALPHNGTRERCRQRRASGGAAGLLDIGEEVDDPRPAAIPTTGADVWVGEGGREGCVSRDDGSSEYSEVCVRDAHLQPGHGDVAGGSGIGAAESEMQRVRLREVSR